MNDTTTMAVLAVLRRSTDGFALTYASCSIQSGMTRSQRFLNRVANWLGADQQPFTDSLNFKRVVQVPLAAVADPKLIDEAMRELASEPVCLVCGRKDCLDVDPSGYYEHAIRYDGAPLLCRSDLMKEEHERFGEATRRRQDRESKKGKQRFLPPVLQ